MKTPPPHKKLRSLRWVDKNAEPDGGDATSQRRRYREMKKRTPAQFRSELEREEEVWRLVREARIASRAGVAAGGEADDDEGEEEPEEVDMGTERCLALVEKWLKENGVQDGS